MANELLTACQAIQEQLVSWRRYFHMYPELGYQEEHTGAKIAQLLSAYCDQVTACVGGHGVVGMLKGSRDGPTLALRADMDALPLQEENQAAYRSTVPGVMHACGHDAHLAILLGTARILAERRNFPGCVKFIFQPAEECLPEGGAQAMIQAGVLDCPRVEAMLALHVSAQLEYGRAAVPQRHVMAGGDVFQATIRGSGTHGATPHNGVDAVVEAAQAIMGLQTIVSRSLDATEAGVVSVCGIRSSSWSNNVLPEAVDLQGTVRFANPQRKDFFKQKIEQILAGVCQQYGGGFRLDYRYGYPPTVNNPALAAMVRGWMEPLLGKERISAPDKPAMSSEDVSRYFQQVPGCYIWLGAKTPDRATSLHNARFDIDERALALGCALMANNTLHFLQAAKERPAAELLNE